MTSPWVREVEAARVQLVCAWPGLPARIVRGAICQELELSLSGEVVPTWDHLHAEWHGHGMSERTPRVLYRDWPGIYTWGEGAHDRARMLGERVKSLRLPGGRVLAVEGADLRLSVVEVQMAKKAWRRYRLATPLYPSDSAYGRRPREHGPERVAWAGRALASAIERFGREIGLPLDGLHVHVERMEDRHVEWARPGRDILERRAGFVAEFVTNIKLPPGIGLGAKRAEGFGEIACL